MAEGLGEDAAKVNAHAGREIAEAQRAVAHALWVLGAVSRVVIAESAVGAFQGAEFGGGICGVEGRRFAEVLALAC